MIMRRMLLVRRLTRQLHCLQVKCCVLLLENEDDGALCDLTQVLLDTIKCVYRHKITCPMLQSRHSWKLPDLRNVTCSSENEGRVKLLMTEASTTKGCGAAHAAQAMTFAVHLSSSC